MSSRPLVLATLLPSLLEGCGNVCGNGRHWEDLTNSISCSPEQVEEARDAFGELTPEGCERLCKDALQSDYEEFGEIYSCELVENASPPSDETSDGDTISVACSYSALVHDFCVGGRDHASILRKPPPDTENARTAWLIQSARAEAASVGAFRRLARELTAHDAPQELIDRAKEAALDEIRHARLFRALARTPIPSVGFGPPPERSLFALALENAVEGCVRETHAALVAHHQARHAQPALRPLFASIAADETRHGQWSWDLDAWLRTRLTAREQRALDLARTRALATLGHSAPVPEVCREMGLPPPAVARRLAVALACALGA